MRAKTKVIGGGLALFIIGAVLMSLDLTPYLDKAPVPGLDRSKRHRVDFEVRWVPDRNILIGWTAQPESDHLNVTHSPWKRVAYVDGGALIGLGATASLHHQRDRTVRCRFWVDGVEVVESSSGKDRCTLRYVVPPD